MMFPALGSLLAKSVAPAVAEHLARSGMQALQGRLRRDPSLAPATSAEIVAAVNHYNASPERVWTRERLFAFVAFFVSAGPDGTVDWIETPQRIADYVLRGPRPGDDPAARAVIGDHLQTEMESVRALMARYLTMLATEPQPAAPEPAVEPVADSEALPDSRPLPDTGPPGDATSAGPADPAHARLSGLLARVVTPAGAAVARARESARQASDTRKSRALVEDSFELLHAGGVGLAQAEAYLLRKGQPAEIVRAAVARRVGGG